MIGITITVLSLARDRGWQRLEKFLIRHFFLAILLQLVTLSRVIFFASSDEPGHNYPFGFLR